MTTMNFARMKSEIEKLIEIIEGALSFPINANRISKELNELREDKIKLQAKKEQLLADEKMVREEIEMQMKNDDKGLTPTKDVLRLILNRLGLEPSLPYKGEDVKALGLSEEETEERE